jgi:hypothetical protein
MMWINHEGHDEHEGKALNFVPFAPAWLKEIVVAK